MSRPKITKITVEIEGVQNPVEFKDGELPRRPSNGWGPYTTIMCKENLQRMRP